MQITFKSYLVNDKILLEAKKKTLRYQGTLSLAVNVSMLLNIFISSKYSMSIKKCICWAPLEFNLFHEKVYGPLPHQLVVSHK